MAAATAGEALFRGCPPALLLLLLLLLLAVVDALLTDRWP